MHLLDAENGGNPPFLKKIQVHDLNLFSEIYELNLSVGSFSINIKTHIIYSFFLTEGTQVLALYNCSFRYNSILNSILFMASQIRCTSGPYWCVGNADELLNQ